MAIISVTISREPSISNITLSGSMGFLVKFSAYTSYSQMYREACLAIDPSSGIKIPQEGTNLDGDEPQEGDPLCTNAVASLHEEQNLWWKVRCTFGGSDNPSSQDGGGTFDVAPWKKAKVYKWGHTNIQKRMTVDANNKPMLNSAGEAFDESLFTPVAVRTVTATWIVRKGSWNPIKGTGFINTTNSRAFRLSGNKLQAGSAFCTANDGTLTTATFNGSEVPIWQRTASWQVITGDGDWDGMVLDQGHMQYNHDDDRLYPINDTGGNKFTSPQQLNGAGLRLKKARGGFYVVGKDFNGSSAPSKGLPIDFDNTTSERVWLKFVPYESSNHSAIL